MIKLNSNIDKFKKSLLKEFEFASLVAINDAAFAISRDLNDATSMFQGGAAAFTKKSFFVSEKASKDNISKLFKLEATVEAKPQQAKYLRLALAVGERQTGDYATTNRGVLLPGSAAKLNAQGNLSRNSIKRSLSAKNTFSGSIRLSGGKQLRGVFKREILQRKTKAKPQTTRLKVLAVFKDRVSYKKNTKIDIMKISSKRFDTVFNKSMTDAINDLNKFGRVRSSNQRKR